MLDRPNLSRENPTGPRGRRPPPGLLPVKWAAKWPPDDSDLPGAPPAPGGGGFADDGNFKRGRFSPASIVVGLLLALGAAGAIWFGVKQESQRMTVDAIAKEKKNIFVLPKNDQLPLWRTWAASNAEPSLQQEALMQLAWAGDPEGITLATKTLSLPDHRVKGVAAQVLAYYGSPKADSAKPALLEALKAADESDRPQIVWSLIELKEPAAFKDAMDQYRKGFLSKVERLGGGMAFDPEKLAGLVSLEELAKLATDESPSVRQLVATVLSRNAESKWTSALISLVKDKDVEVAREAANGLGRIGDETARAPLLEALSNADKDSRQRFLEALRDGIGGEGLVLALESVKTDPEETTWFQTKQIMEMLRELADPRSADPLVKWIEAKKPPLHWQGEAGTRLAEVGDIRGARYIGERMLADPLKLYKLEKFWEADEGGHLSRTDLPRVVGARMLADLATVHADKSAELKAAAEAPIILWLKDRPQPHANGLRFLATIRSEKILKDMRDWAFPTDPLPKEGQQPPFPAAFETAQSALRYVGRMKDEPSYPRLLDQFNRKKDPKMDITQDGLQGAGLAMMGMALRAVAYGASQGLAEWGDPRAVEPLTKLIEDEMWHEEARQAACEALAWCADDKAMIEVAKKAKEFASQKEPRKQLIGACYASSLALRPVPSAAGELVPLLVADVDPGVRMAIARAIGIGGFDEAVQGQLFEKLKDVEVRNAAALALILGGTSDTAARTVAMYADFDKAALDDLKDHYYRAFGYWSDEDFKRGNLYRYVANAEAITRVKVAEAPQEWARQRLQAQFDNLKYDNGPHSETRVVLRYRLYQAAKSGDGGQKKGAIETLKFMKEKGVLMALRHEQGETGALAKRAFHELMNPKATVAEDLSALAPATKAGGAGVQ
ncbi:HEAT repeat domain-containing protein [Sorangium sp. So ce362]|uniref:HEAT repeat domain-containing protein n=1 Tax=Sorangium sp. So ce362 TaxID=3133303 RepID=UPI003F5DFADC